MNPIVTSGLQLLLLYAMWEEQRARPLSYLPHMCLSLGPAPFLHPVGPLPMTQLYHWNSYLGPALEAAFLLSLSN